MNNMFSTTYLWCEVEPQIAVVGKPILDKKRNLSRQAKLDAAGQTRSLAEVDKVLERKGQGNWLGKLNLDVGLWLVDVGVRAKSDGSRSNVTIASKLDAFFCALDRDCDVVLGARPQQRTRLYIPDSDKAMRSLQIRWNSVAGMSIVAAYSVSGIPRCS